MLKKIIIIFVSIIVVFITFYSLGEKSNKNLNFNSIDILNKYKDQFSSFSLASFENSAFLQNTKVFEDNSIKFKEKKDRSDIYNLLWLKIVWKYDFIIKNICNKYNLNQDYFNNYDFALSMQCWDTHLDKWSYKIAWSIYNKLYEWKFNNDNILFLNRLVVYNYMVWNIKKWDEIKKILLTKINNIKNWWETNKSKKKLVNEDYALLFKSISTWDIKDLKNKVCDKYSINDLWNNFKEKIILWTCWVIYNYIWDTGKALNIFLWLYNLDDKNVIFLENLRNYYYVNWEFKKWEEYQKLLEKFSKK